MATGIADLKTGVRDILAESSAATWTDAEVVRAINSRKNRIARKMALVNETILLQRYYLDLVEDQHNYPLGIKTIAVRRVQYVGETPPVTGTKIRDYDFWRYESSTTSGSYTKEFHWFFEGAYLYLWPAPNFAYTNGLRIWRQYIPADMADPGGTLDLNMEVAKDWLMYESAKKCLYHRGDNITDISRDIEEEKNDVLNTIGMRQKAEPEYVDAQWEDSGGYYDTLWSDID